MSRSKVGDGVGVARLRVAVRLLDDCRESFNDRYSAEELLRISRCFTECAWEIMPDAWTPRQVKEALQGIVPDWKDPAKHYGPIPRYGSDQKVILFGRSGVGWHQGEKIK